MPIFVQWKWMERPDKPSFLVVFHFIDDYSKSNLRTINPKEVHFWNEVRGWITWAPSHLEEALLADILRYANMVDGLSEYKLRKLRDVLGGKSAKASHNLMKELPDKTHFYHYNSVTHEVKTFCVELCPEYIDYLKKVLKPYIS